MVEPFEILKIKELSRSERVHCSGSLPFTFLSEPFMT